MKKIILGTAILLSALTFTGCGSDAKINSIVNDLDQEISSFKTTVLSMNTLSNKDLALSEIAPTSAPIGISDRMYRPNGNNITMLPGANDKMYRPNKDNITTLPYYGPYTNGELNSYRRNARYDNTNLNNYIARATKVYDKNVQLLDANMLLNNSKNRLNSIITFSKAQMPRLKQNLNKISANDKNALKSYTAGIRDTNASIKNDIKVATTALSKFKETSLNNFDEAEFSISILKTSLKIIKTKVDACAENINNANTIIASINKGSRQDMQNNSLSQQNGINPFKNNFNNEYDASYNNGISNNNSNMNNNGYNGNYGSMNNGYGYNNNMNNNIDPKMTNNGYNNNMNGMNNNSNMNNNGYNTNSNTGMNNNNSNMNNNGYIINGNSANNGFMNNNNMNNGGGNSLNNGGGNNINSRDYYINNRLPNNNNGNVNPNLREQTNNNNFSNNNYDKNRNGNTGFISGTISRDGKIMSYSPTSQTSNLMPQSNLNSYPIKDSINKQPNYAKQLLNNI